MTFRTILFFLTSLFSCNIEMSENEKFIQGTWYFSEEVSEGFSSFQKWQFEKGTFTMEGYPPIHRKGSYQVIFDEENIIRLSLKEDENKEQILKLTLDKENQALLLNATGSFVRR